MWLFHFLSWTAVTVSAQETLYGKIGDKAVLTPDSVVNPINSIEWKHGPDIAMDWYGGETSSYRHFKDRGRLDTSTGALTITGLTPDDSGTYTAEINGKVASKTELLVISPVSEPTVSDWCEPEMTYCNLTCNGSTTGAEPVTYRWTSGDIMLSSTKEHKITKDDKEPWFSCAFENPVSLSSSKKVFNPFINKEPLYGKIGDEAVLTPDSVVDPITSIVWTHGLDIAMEWYGGETFSYRHFKDRGMLDTSTGALTITGLTRDDSGTYTVEINDKVASKTELLVISPVSKPTVSDWCAMTYCVLTCSGSTTGAEPVTYWWTSGDVTWPSTKEHKLTTVEWELWFSWLSCGLENPVSNISSEQVFNPFIRNLLIFIAVFILFVCIITIIYLRSKGISFSRKWRWVLKWTFIFIFVFIFIPVVLIIIIIYVIYKDRKEDLTWVFNFIPVWVLVGCVIILVYLIYKGIIYFSHKWKKQILIGMFIFMSVFIFIPVVIIIFFIVYVIYKGKKEDLTWVFNFIPVWMLVGCIIILVYLIYKGIIYFSRKWRKGEAVDGTEEEATEMLQPDQKTSTQDPTSVVVQDTSNGTEATEMLQPDQKTSTQDPTSVVAPDTSNGTVISTISEVHETQNKELETSESPDTSNETERTTSLVAVQETSTQDTTSTVPPETSNETERSAASPEVTETSTEDQKTAESPDPSNETEKSAMIPDDPETCRL